MNDKLDPWLVGGLHPSEIPEIAAAAKRADAQAERLDTPQAVWIRPNSAASIWVNEDSPAERLQGCVMVYSTEDGWIGKD
jgi:hypothetical protein